MERSGSGHNDDELDHEQFMEYVMGSTPQEHLQIKQYHESDDTTPAAR